MPDTSCVGKGETKRAFSLQLSVLAKFFFGPKQCKAGSTIKIGVSAEIGQKQNGHLFLEKGVFLTWLKKWVNCVFEKPCFPENTIFIVFSAKHSLSKTKTVC